MVINELGDHLEISFSMKGMGPAEVILQEVKEYPFAAVRGVRTEKKTKFAEYFY